MHKTGRDTMNYWSGTKLVTNRDRVKNGGLHTNPKDVVSVVAKRKRSGSAPQDPHSKMSGRSQQVDRGRLTLVEPRVFAGMLPPN